MDDDILKLDNQLCFKIYSASRTIIRLYKPVLDKLGLTYPQYVTMLVLWEQDNILFKTLSERLSLKSGTLTPILKRLEKAGLLTRTRGTDDERKVYIRLTDEGKELKKEAVKVPQAMGKILEISKEEYLNLMSYFVKIDTLLHSLEEKGE